MIFSSEIALQIPQIETNPPIPQTPMHLLKNDCQKKYKKKKIDNTFTCHYISAIDKAWR
jgi:hypothetical protein